MALNFANNNSLSAITTLPASISGGAMTLISEQTASSSATIDFTSNIDSTYDVYCFKFINIHADTDNQAFTFQTSTNGGSSYGVTLTSTSFLAYHNESDAASGLFYAGGGDLAQSTSFQQLCFSDALGNGADENACGELYLYNPSSTTFVKHYIARFSHNSQGDTSHDSFPAGYFNTTSAINGIQFKMASGTIDGTIKMYGVA
jgi:hypothetical protein